MKPQRGFTLIELVITVAIVGLLATAAMPLLELTVKRGKEAELRVSLREIRGALDAYKHAADQGLIEREADSSGYPPSLATLVDGVEDATSPDHRRLYFLRRIPRDPFADRLHAGTVLALPNWNGARWLSLRQLVSTRRRVASR